MPAQLQALSEGPSILLDKPILLLGRHPECDIQIDSRKISRRHCCIAQVHDYLIVRDLGSTNGIRINGERVTEGKLISGDELTIGNHRYKVTWDPVPGTPPRQKARDTFRSGIDHAVAEDEALESCDEPVPLAEPDASLGYVPTPCAPGSIPRPPAEDDASFILPDQLELMPGSDAFRDVSPSGSHHPGS
jgi:predicted component of type VI protein secretion system